MNKHEDESTYYVIGVAMHVDHWLSRYDKDHVMVLRSPTPEIRRNRHAHKIVAWCPTKEAAVAAKRLLSGECGVWNALATAKREAAERIQRATMDAIDWTRQPLD
jgi:hypothetical protein